MSRDPNVPDSLLPFALDSRPWRAVATLAVLTALRVGIAARMPITPDEAYYWTWTRPLQLSYLDHPGMAAWWIAASTALGGDGALAVRLPALLAAPLVTLLVWDCGRRAFASRVAGTLAAAWLNAMLLFGAGAVLMTPDSPLLLFWALVLWAILRLVESGRVGWLYLAGLAGGLGFDSKYTIGLMVPGLAVCFLALPGLRRWWGSPHPWMAGLLAIAAAAPVLVWNATHGWISFHKQLGHAFLAVGGSPVVSLATWIGGQAGLATPLIFGFALAGMVWVPWQGWRRGIPEWVVIGTVSLPVLVFFAIDSLNDPVQAHWAGPAWLAGMLAAAGAAPALSRTERRAAWYRAAPLLGLAITCVVYLQAATAAIPLPARLDPLRQLGGWDELAAVVARAREAHPGAFILVIKHEEMGLLEFYLPGHPTVFLAEGGTMPSSYGPAQVAALRGGDALLVLRDRPGEEEGLAPDFGAVEPLTAVDLHWAGEAVSRYRIWLGHGYRGGAIAVEEDGSSRTDAP